MSDHTILLWTFIITTIGVVAGVVPRQNYERI
jgi:hypothetical protein